jgi:arsenate reductase (glutaredoxin)
MSLKCYLYQGCSTCKSATKWLKQQGISVSEIPIRETPPSPEELSIALDSVGGEMRLICNTSGQDYRALGMKDRLPGLSRSEFLELLSTNGNLIKRPLLLNPETKFVLVGFKPEVWEKAFAN